MSAIKMQTRLSRKYLATGKSSRLYLMMALTANEKEAGSDRLPLNMGFVIDRSGSMAGGKLAYTKKAVNYAVSHLTTRDYASLTVYDDEVDVLVGGQPVSDKDYIKGYVNRIFCGGCTNLSGGLVAGYREVMRHLDHNRTNRVLLLTDGLANRGITDRKSLCRKATEMKKTGVAVTTMGVGEDFDEDLLMALAEASGGNYFFIDSTDKIPEIFAQEMQSLLSVLAQNVGLAFSPATCTAVTRVWGYQPEGDRDIRISLPDIYSSDRKVILLELAVQAQRPGSIPIGSLSVSYEDAEADLKFESYTFDLAVECTNNETLLAEDEDVEVMLNVELNRAADSKEEAIRLADGGDIDGAMLLMMKQKQALSSYTAGALSADYNAELSEELNKLDSSLHSLRKENYSPMLRKKLSYESYQRRKSQKLKGN